MTNSTGAGQSALVPDAAIETSCDRFLGGRVAVFQPRRGGHRSGHDAILLAACVPADATGDVADLGAGVGVAGLAVAARVPGVDVTLAERDPVALTLARRSLDLPETAPLAPRVRIVAVDVTAPARERLAAGLARESADHVILNPPFYPAGSVRETPDAARAGAHVLDDAGLDPWIRTAADLLRPRGRIALIFPATGLKSVLDGLEGRFGAIAIRPVLPRPEGPALRILVGGIKGSRGPLTLLAPLVLHDSTGAHPAPQAAEILSGTAGIDLV